MDLLGKRLFRGERVYLSPLNKADMTLYAEWFSDLETLSYSTMGHVYPQTLQAEQQWYDRVTDGGSYPFGIRLTENDQLIGNIMLQEPDWRSRVAEVGIGIGDKNYWSKGYGTEAMQLLVRFGFWELNLNRIELGVTSFNQRAIRSYEKAGFKVEVVERQALYRDGIYHDSVIMAILREEWEATNHAR
jgi:RimJ/RimL family protein N-acetyltransferase